MEELLAGEGEELPDLLGGERVLADEHLAEAQVDPLRPHGLLGLDGGLKLLGAEDAFAQECLAEQGVLGRDGHGEASA